MLFIYLYIYLYIDIYICKLGESPVCRTSPGAAGLACCLQSRRGPLAVLIVVLAHISVHLERDISFADTGEMRQAEKLTVGKSKTKK